jgi:hypothetical protein
VPHPPTETIDRAIERTRTALGRGAASRSSVRRQRVEAARRQKRTEPCYAAHAR